MLIASKKDLEALRIGIRAEVNRERDEADWKNLYERISARKRVENFAIRTAEMLIPGDVLVATDNGYSFYEAGTIVNVETDHDGKPVAGDFWISYDNPRGGGAHAFKRYDKVLVKI